MELKTCYKLGDKIGGCFQINQVILSGIGEIHRFK